MSSWLEYADQLIGWTYDVFGNYADPGCVRTQIFNFSDAEVRYVDVGNATVGYPDLPFFQHDPADRVRDDVRVGVDLNHYSRSFGLAGNRSGKYKLFSGSIARKFGWQKDVWTLSAFASKNYFHQLGIFNLHMVDLENWLDDPVMSQYISAKFKEDLLNKEARQFLREYGTHWITKIFLGGRCNLDYTSLARYEVTATTLERQVRAAYDALKGSIEGGSNTEWKKVQAESSKEQTLHIETVGGKSELIYSNPRGWMENVRNAPSLIAFDLPETEVSQGLIPVWALLKSGSARRKELEDVYGQLLEEHKILEIKCYSGERYTGDSLTLGIGEYPALGKINPVTNWNDKIKSIEIPEGLCVTAWQHNDYIGKKIGPIKGPEKIYKVFRLGEWSSMKIEPTEDVEPFVIFFDYPFYDKENEWDYYQGHISLVAADYSDLQDTNEEQWRNTIDAMRIPKGLWVEAWDYPNFDKTRWEYSEGSVIKKLPSGQINNIDSLKVRVK